jgi:restriction system protein
MARKKTDDFFSQTWDLFMCTPWWVSPLVAVSAYVALSWLIPSQLNQNPAAIPLSILSKTAAPWAFWFFLFMGALTSFKKWNSGKLLDQQQGTETVSDLSWQEFEELVGAAYRRQGYQVQETGGGGADGGVDLILHRDNEKILVQCKHWKTYSVGVKQVRELYGITHSKEHAGSRGIFVSFGRYTKEATEFAKINKIELVNRERLMQLIQSAQSDRASLSRQTTPAPDKLSIPNTICPLCGKPMVLRTAQRGINAGSQFWGCSEYPKCRGTREYRSVLEQCL